MGVVSFDAMIEKMAAHARADRAAWAADGWARVAEAVAGQETPFVEWARAHRRWRYVVAEAAEAVCAKPREAASWILHAVVEDILDEDD